MNGVAVCLAKSALALLLLSAPAIRAQDRDVEGDSIFPDGFESGDASAWSSFEPAYTLTLSNFASWCSFSVNGSPSSTAASFTDDFLPGAVVNLSAAPEGGFVWGYWIGTDFDTGSPPHDTNMSTVVTMSADRSVVACCPLEGQTSC